MDNVMQAYDSSNIFAKILRKDIPAKIIHETAHTLAFHDAFPKTPIHALVIPKGTYVTLHDFCKHASDVEITDFWRVVDHVLITLNMEENGYRLISNNGANGGQEVPHFHVHMCGGEKLGTMLVK
jgi:diadenosine tetraphosphate (Ap4A) HIT family hydrolase